MNSTLETLLQTLIDGDTLEFTPRSSMEEYLKACINKEGTEHLPTPRSRADALLYILAEKLSSGGGSSGDSNLPEWQGGSY